MQTTNGSIAADEGTVQISTIGASNFSVQISGTFSATLQLEGTVDGKNWAAIYGTPPNSVTPASSTTAAGLWIGNCAGMLAVRVRASAFSSGPALVALGAISSIVTPAPTGNPASPFRVKKTMTFAGATPNDPGDFDGSGNPATLFTITGHVFVQLIGIVRTSLVSTDNLSVFSLGVAGGATGFLGETTVDGTNFVADQIISSDAASLALISLANSYTGLSKNIIQTIADKNITSGVIDYYCLWVPLSADGKVEAA